MHVVQSKPDIIGCFFGVGVNLLTNSYFFTLNGSLLESLSDKTATDIHYKTFNLRK